MKRLISRRTSLFSIFSLIISSKFAFSKNVNLISLKDKELSVIKIGDTNAKIKIKEYFSLTCSHCADFHLKTFPIVKKNLIDQGQMQFEFVEYPLDRLAMYSSLLVRSLPKKAYLDAVEILLKNQKKWVYTKSPMAELLKISRFFGISKSQFEKIIDNQNLMNKILNRMETDSKKFNIQSTPTFIVNDKHKISGTLSYIDFKRKIDDFSNS